MKKTDKDIIIAMLPLILILIIEIFFKVCNGGIYVILGTNGNSLIFSIIMGYIIYAILISIFKKMSKATQIFSISMFILLIINQLKIIYTAEPLMFSDINFISQIGKLTTMISSSIIKVFLKYIICFIILAIIFILLIRWTKKNEFEINNLKIRKILLITSIILTLILFVPNKYTREIYLNIFFKTDERHSYTTILDYYRNYTLLSGMYGTMLNNRFTEPNNYDAEKIDEILNQEYDEEENDWGNPNIICIFSESFWDIDKLEEIEFNREVASNLKRLKNEGKYIELISCSYGGKSENVAFELLTGGSMNYFTEGYIPVMSLYKRENSENIPSIVKELKRNNYYSKIIFGKDYYSSEKAFKKIGFDTYIDLKETNENIKGEYISDEYIIDTIINDLENKSDNKKVFYLAETIQNHMQYESDKYESYDISIVQSNLGEEENGTILSYAQGVYDADKQLNRLYEYILNYEEPTILVFLGDHLPFLYTEKRKKYFI